MACTQKGLEYKVPSYYIYEYIKTTYTPRQAGNVKVYRTNQTVTAHLGDAPQAEPRMPLQQRDLPQEAGLS